MGVRGLFPNSDYTIFVGRDAAFGIVGHPFERSLCVFGIPAVAAFARRDQGVLADVIRHRWATNAGRHTNQRHGQRMSFDLAVVAVPAGANETTARALIERCYGSRVHIGGGLDERIVAFYEELEALKRDGAARVAISFT